MKRLTYLAATPLALCIAQPSLAQDTQDTALDLGKVVISGGLTPIAESAFGRASTVITAEEIENSGKQSVADLLRRVPGVAVSRTGAFGGLTQVRIRGNEGNGTKVFIDGIDVSTPSQGEFDFSSLLTADIERIEVLRGPQSSLFGSNAQGGVVSIITKRATEPGVSGSASLELGGENTIFAQGAGRYAGPRGDLSLSVARFQTDGFDVSGTSNDSSFRDGSENTTFSANGRIFLNDSVTFGGVLRYTDRSTDGDRDVFGAPTIDTLVAESNDQSDRTSFYGLAFAEFEVFEGRMLNRLDISYVDEDSQFFRNNAQTSGSESMRKRFTYTGTVALDASTVDRANHTLSFSYQWQEETFQQVFQPSFAVPPSFFDKQERTQNSYVLEYRGSFADALDFQASVRHDDNEVFEDFTSYAVGASYRIMQTGSRLHASVGTGSVNPTFNEQFGFFNNFVGNPNLKPEESFGWDIGFEQTFLDGRAVVDVTYFREDVDNEIRNIGTTSINLTGTSHREGIEVTGRFAFTDSFDLSLGYTYLDATEEVPTQAGGSRDVVEVRRPEHSFSLAGTYRLPNNRTTITGELETVSGLFDLDFRTSSFLPGGQFDDDFDRIQLGNYVLVNVAARHQINDRLTLTGGVTNLMDADYQELAGFATQGRTFYVGLAASF
ncbi:MAG: TonB-dependent receptor [Pseudomonadota bacterium]